jgi:type I restriction enzyme, S subunit
VTAVAKASGIGSGWRWLPLEDCCTFHNGLWTGKKPPFETATVIRNTNFTADGSIDLSDVAVLEVEAKQLSKRRLLKGDIIIEKSGGGPKQPVGRVVLFDIDDGVYSFSNFTSAIRVKDQNQLDPRFLHRVLYGWYVDGRTEPLQRRSTGIRNLDFSAYQRLEVPIPPLEEQKRIVAVLDQAFAALDCARSHAEANLADAEALLSQTVEAALCALGEPQPIGRHVDLLSGFAFKSGGYTDDPEDVRLIRGDNIVQGTFRWDGVKRWPKSERSVYARYELAADDVLIAMDRTWVSAGIKYAVVDEEALPSLLVQRVARLRTKSTLLPSFLAICIGSNRFERYVLDIQTGLGVPHVSGKQLEAFEVPIPDLDAQRDFVERIEAIRGRSKALTANLRASLSDIADLRQTLLQKAFAGELT